MVPCLAAYFSEPKILLCSSASPSARAPRGVMELRPRLHGECHILTRHGGRGAHLSSVLIEQGRDMVVLSGADGEHALTHAWR